MINSYTKVLFLGMNIPEIKYVGKYEIHGVKIRPLNGMRWSLKLAIRDGFDGVVKKKSVLKAEMVDQLYRDHDSDYLKYCYEIIDNIKNNNFEIIFFCAFNFIHPELINKELSGRTKVLGFIDDPHSTYIRGIPYLWAFDAAYYISPSYSNEMSFIELFNKVGFNKVRWLPLVQPIDYSQLSFEEVINRGNLSCYVGNPTKSKYNRIKKLKESFGDQFKLYGRWPFSGYYGYVQPIFGAKPFFERVRSISDSQKQSLYLNTKIGFNMHVSDYPAESGNARTYEIAAYGMMPLSDRGGKNMQNMIFEEGTEAIYYSDTDEAIDLVKFYGANDKIRAKIAYRAHQRYCGEYQWEKVILDFLKWL